MQESLQEEGISTMKKSMSDAQRKAKQREKLKQIQSGQYVVPLIEEAKQVLKESLQYDIAALFNLEKFQKGLQEQDIKKLKIFISNQKQRLKIIGNNDLSKEQKQLNNKEKAQRLGNQQIPQLHQSLLTPQTSEERKDLIRKKIEENMFLFLEYMEGYQPPTQDFLEIILGLYDELDKETATKLFVRVCSMHRGECLNINQNMVQEAMQFLIEYKNDNIAAFGLLRLVFQNDISFFSFPLHLLQEFQQQYEQTIQNFYKSIPKLPFQVTESLPSTCYCFTKPFLKALKDGGHILHRQIPHFFLPYFIEILAYSFTDDIESFIQFIDIFKDGCRKYYEILLQSEFSNLLQSLSEEAKAMSQQFFKTITHTTEILQRSFELLYEKKLIIFDQENVTSIINCSRDQYYQMKSNQKSQNQVVNP